jgi:hypothetical protein
MHEVALPEASCREIKRAEGCAVAMKQYVNYYKCPDDGTEWTMVWTCMCDDRCPKCHHEIVPYRSEERPSTNTNAVTLDSQSDLKCC